MQVVLRTALEEVNIVDSSSAASSAIQPSISTNIQDSGIKLTKNNNFFFRNNYYPILTIILPPRTRAIHYWSQIKKLGNSICFIFLTFYNLIWFLELQIPFREYSIPSPVRNVFRLQFLSCEHGTLMSGQYSFPKMSIGTLLPVN